MKYALLVLGLLATFGAGIWVGQNRVDSPHRRLTFEQSLNPEQKTRAEKILKDFSEMKVMTLVEYDNGGIALVGKEDRYGFKVFFSEMATR